MMIIGYEPEHAILMSAMLNEPKRRHHPNFESWARAAAYDYPAITVVGDGGTPLVSAGVRWLWENVGEVWAFVSREARAYPKSLTVYARRIVDSWWDHFRYRRLQATVDNDNMMSRRFVEHLGFSFEGVLRRYGPDDIDQAMYARVRDE